MKTLAFLLAMAAAAAAQVGGTASYQDRAYTPSGFTGVEPYRPIRQAEVEIVHASSLTVLGTGATDESGAFSVPGIPGGTPVFARIYARRAGGGINAAILNNAAQNAVYAAVTATVTTAPAVATTIPPLNVTIGGAGPAFNIFDCAVKSFQFQATLGGEPLPPVPPLLRIYWEAGSSTGTYYTRLTNAVYLLGVLSDPDQYDDDIILHEIGHWVAYNFSRDDTRGGPHSVTEQLDPRTAWSEGWAHFWSSLVRRAFPGEYVAPAFFLDNFGSGASVFEIEGPSYPAVTVMATNELAVAAALWDITDAANEGSFDTLLGNEAEIWRAVNVRIPGMSNITMEDFRAGLAAEAPGIMAEVTGSETVVRIMNARAIRYYPNASEPNDNPAAATPLAPGQAGQALRTIFPTDDSDWYSLALGPGTLRAQTLNLGDGADTILELYDPNGTTLLASSDDRSPSDRSSLLIHPLTRAGTYFLHVRRSGVVVENGYYDIRAEHAANLPPSLGAAGASPLTGTAPLRVTFFGGASDPEGGHLQYAWDFDGDGQFDWTSLQGATVTRAFPAAGTYTALLRVVDGSNAYATATATITVLPAAAPAIAVTRSPGAGQAPLAVTFGASLSGLTPAAFAWDFNLDGVPDRVSVVSASATHTYRAPGSHVARLTVHDVGGRAYEALSDAVLLDPGTSPPAIGSFTATEGLVPYASTLTVTHSDPGGSIARVEFDLDGDGLYELEMPPGSPGSTSLVHPVRRVGLFTLRARVTDGSGLTAERTAAMLATQSGTRGWIIDPLAGDRVAGSGVTITAEAVPRGRAKRVQFQHRRDSPPGPWLNIGPAVISEGTLFSARWNVAPFERLSRFDLRVLIDDAVSSGDDACTVVVDALAPDIDESGGVRVRRVPPSRTVISRSVGGVWLIVPRGTLAGPSSALFRLEPAAAPPTGGSAADLVLQGSAWRVSVEADFQNTFRLRFPLEGNGRASDIHEFDAGAGAWRRLFFSRVSHEDGWVEADVASGGLYAVFGVNSLESGSSSRGTCSASAGAGPALPWTAFPALLALGLLACARRR